MRHRMASRDPVIKKQRCCFPNYSPQMSKLASFIPSRI